MRLNRLQTIGIVVGLVGVFLVAYVTPNVTTDARSFTFEPPPDPLSWKFSPGVFIATIGVIYVLTGLLGLVADRLPRYAHGAFVLSGVLFLPLAIAVALALSDQQSTNVIQLLVESLRLGTPIALGAMAGLWCERSGVVNIGIEGMMLGSAGIGFMAYALLGDANSVPWLWAAIGIAVLTGGLIAALHALMSVTFRVDQIISGVVINLLALGITGFLRSEVIVPDGVTSGVPTSALALPLLNRIPIVGPQLFTGKPIFFADVHHRLPQSGACCSTPAFGPAGPFRGRAPPRGRDRRHRRHQHPLPAVIIGGMIAGLGGALVLHGASGRLPGQHDQRHRLHRPRRLIFGKWRPWTAFAGAMLFGFSRALGSRLRSSASRSATSRSRASSGSRCPSSSPSSWWPGSSAGPSRPAADGQPFRAQPMTDASRRRLGRAAGPRPPAPRRGPTRRTRTSRSAPPACCRDGSVHQAHQRRERQLRRRHLRRDGHWSASSSPAAAGAGDLVAVAVTDPDGNDLSPCGRCRQLLHEMGGPGLLVNERTIAELLPGAFGPDDLT